MNIVHLKGKSNVVADALSRIPGSELLTDQEVHSMTHTLNICHVQDLPVKLVSSVKQCDDLAFLHGIISINERETFRDKLLSEQASCSSVWFENLRAKALSGDSVF